MKKIIILFLGLTIIASACGGEKKAENQKSEPTKTNKATPVKPEKKEAYTEILKTYTDLDLAQHGLKWKLLAPKGSEVTTKELQDGKLKIIEISEPADDSSETDTPAYDDYYLKVSIRKGGSTGSVKEMLESEKKDLEEGEKIIKEDATGFIKQTSNPWGDQPAICYETYRVFTIENIPTTFEGIVCKKDVAEAIYFSPKK